MQLSREKLVPKEAKNDVGELLKYFNERLEHILHETMIEAKRKPEMIQRK